MKKLNIVKLCYFHNLKYFAKICISYKTIEYYQIAFIEEKNFWGLFFIGFDQTLKKELTKAAAAEWCCNQRE